MNEARKTVSFLECMLLKAPILGIGEVIPTY
jgi:hypothetical protein